MLTSQLGWQIFRTSQPWFLLLALSGIYSIYILLTEIYRRRNMPPGPTGLPFIGNRHQMPARKPWRKFADLNREYGPVVSLHFGKTPTIVLGSAEAAWDLLEKRSEIYSSRPRFIMAGEILSDNNRGLMLPYGPSWRKWRKAQHSSLHARVSSSYKPIQSLESKLAMHHILDTPEKYEKHLQRYAASVATSVAYGRRVESVDEWIVKENMESMDYLTSIPGKHIVESLPWLLYLPKALQWFRTEPLAQKARDILYLTHLLEDVKFRMATMSVPDCMATRMLKDMERNEMSELEVAYGTSSPFGAGIETTAGSLTSFILAMLHFPEVMQRGQTEIDSVVGFKRMPEFEDAKTLPYINAIINETLRWKPVAVLGGTPHAVTEDDWYNGMFIPKGSTVFANLFGIMQDPTLFPTPGTFNPDRFLTTGNPRLRSFDLPFGFGRRVCPGQHLALQSLFINVSRLLWAFDILPAIDPETGKPTLPDADNFTDGFNSRPVSFTCRILPRNDSVKAVIRREFEIAKQSLEEWNW